MKYATRLEQKWGVEWVKKYRRDHRPKILVAAYSATEWLRGDFATAVIQLKAGEYPFTYLNQRRTPIHLARQVVADYALENGFDYLFQLDDDAMFPQNLLPYFIGHDKDVVVALAYQRKPPYMSVAYDLAPDAFDDKGNLNLDKEGLRSRTLDNIEGQGLRRVDVSGFHCSAIRTSVFQKLRDAGIRQYYGGFENKLGEDFCLSLNLKKIGVPIWMDTNFVSGHIGDPVVIDANYKTLYKAGRAP